MKAIREIGFGEAIRYLFYSLFRIFFKALPFSPLRVLSLYMLGAQIGKNVVVEDLRLINLHKKGLACLKIGDNCFLGPEALLDLSESITLEKNVTISSRAALLTHTNVGYADHPLQKILPKKSYPLTIGENSFVGFGGIIVGPSKIGPNTIIAAGAVVVKNNRGNEILVGVPAKRLRSFAL